MIGRQVGQFVIGRRYGALHCSTDGRLEEISVGLIGVGRSKVGYGIKFWKWMASCDNNVSLLSSELAVVPSSASSVIDGYAEE